MAKLIASTTLLLLIFNAVNLAAQPAGLIDFVKKEVWVTPAQSMINLPDNNVSPGFYKFYLGLHNGLVNFVDTSAGLWFVALFMLLMLFLALLPALLEIFRPRDNQPLLINLDYIRDPRYFDKAFLEELRPYLNNPGLLKKNLLKFRDKIPIDYYEDFQVPDSVRMRNLIVVNGNMSTDGNGSFNQPVYVKGNAKLGKNTELQVLMISGKLTLGKNSRIRHWMSANGDVSIKDGSELGNRVVSDGTLELGKDCVFKSIYGMPVATYESHLKNSKPGKNKGPAIYKSENMKRVIDFNWYVSRHIFTIPPQSVVSNSMIIKSNALIRKGAVIDGNLKVYGDITLEQNVTVNGEVICEGDITIGENCIIRENVFSQSYVHVKQGSRIGSVDQFKSAIGKKGIKLDKNVIIYGYVMTAGRGIVV